MQNVTIHRVSSSGIDAYGNPIWSANQNLSNPLQAGLNNIQGQVAQGGGAFNPSLPSTGINPGQTYSDAIMQRLQPQMAQQKQMPVVQKLPNI